MSESKTKVADFVKKALSTGLGAALMTEEVLRDALSDVTNKETLTKLVDNAKATRDEFVKSVKTEVGSYLKRIDLEKEIDRILENYDVEVKANFSFKKKKEKK